MHGFYGSISQTIEILNLEVLWFDLWFDSDNYAPRSSKIRMTFPAVFFARGGFF